MLFYELDFVASEANHLSIIPLRHVHNLLSIKQIWKQVRLRDSYDDMFLGFVKHELQLRFDLPYELRTRRIEDASRNEDQYFDGLCLPDDLLKSEKHGDFYYGSVCIEHARKIKKMQAAILAIIIAFYWLPDELWIKRVRVAFMRYEVKFDGHLLILRIAGC